MSRSLLPLLFMLALMLALAGAGAAFFLLGSGDASLPDLDALAGPYAGMIILTAMVAVPVVLLVVVFVAILWSSGSGDRRLDREGARCTAIIKSYRRISMTQHRVLFLVSFPGAPHGRDWVISGLTDAWLADACALGTPVQVLAHPDLPAVRLLEPR